MSEEPTEDINPPKKMYFKPPENLSTASKEEREAFVEDIVNHLFGDKSK
jgi:hypothetical protein